MTDTTCCECTSTEPTAATWEAPAIKIGDSWLALVLAFTDTETGLAIPFPSGTTAQATLRGYRLGETVHSFAPTVVDNLITLPAIPAATTAGFAPQRATLEVKTTYTNGVVTTWVSAELTISEELP